MILETFLEEVLRETFAILGAWLATITSIQKLLHDLVHNFSGEYDIIFSILYCQDWVNLGRMADALLVQR